MLLKLNRTLQDYAFKALGGLASVFVMRGGSRTPFSPKQVHSFPLLSARLFLLVLNQSNPSRLWSSLRGVSGEYGGSTRLFGRHLHDRRKTFREVMVTSFIASPTFSKRILITAWCDTVIRNLDFASIGDAEVLELGAKVCQNV